MRMLLTLVDLLLPFGFGESATSQRLVERRGLGMMTNATRSSSYFLGAVVISIIILRREGKLGWCRLRFFLLLNGYELTAMANLPFRDINVHASTSHYAFTSPSNPSAPTLVIERPSGDLRLNDGSLLGAKRVSSIAGILGIIKLKLGQSTSNVQIEGGDLLLA
jgi:hypothetical protein